MQGNILKLLQNLQDVKKSNLIVEVMDNAITINKTSNGTEVGLLFEIDTINIKGFGVVLGLGIVALACIVIKCLFLYYIKIHAPKERPLNKLLALEHVRNYKHY